MPRLEWHGDILISKVDAACVDALADIGDLVAQTGQANAPVGKDTPTHKAGTLRDSIHVDPVESNGGVHTVKVVADAPYALPVETGHKTRSGSFVAPQPFLRPAFDTHAGQLLGKLREKLA